jgi:plasmid stabilization system protein ParE
MRVRFSPLAAADLAEIKRYVAQDKPLAAARLIRSLRQRIDETIAHFPAIGQPCDNLSAGLRRFFVGNYVIFYRVTEPSHG